MYDGRVVDLSPHVYPPDEVRSSDTELTSPSRYLLWLHSNVAKVYHAVGAGEKKPEYHDDDEYIAVRAFDGDLIKQTVLYITGDDMDMSYDDYRYIQITLVNKE